MVICTHQTSRPAAGIRGEVRLAARRCCHSLILLRDESELAALLAQGHWAGREGMV